MIIGLWIANVFLIVVLDRWCSEITDTIVSGWILLGRSAAYEEARWVAYLFAFPNAVGGASWLLAFPLYYRHLSEVLRESESE